MKSIVQLLSGGPYLSHCRVEFVPHLVHRRQQLFSVPCRVCLAVEMLNFFCLVNIIACLVSISQAWKDGVNPVDELSYNLMKEDNFKVHNTKLFRYHSGLHVRHDLDIHLVLEPHDHCDEPFKFWLLENNLTVFTWIQNPLFRDGEFHFYLYVNRSIPVGQYTLSSGDSCSKDTIKMVRLCDVNVLFNPWSTQWNTSGDSRVRRQTQSPTNAFNDEYLNNNYGFIWTGNVAIPWSYAVGSKSVTDSKNRLTQLMSQTERSSQVQYARALSRLIASNVLYGRWSGDYDDGVEPGVWVGSEEILRRWLQSGQRVRYAQCWVFAGVLTTMLRASGIPARTVTNYNSHHDRGLTSNGRAVLRQYDNIIQTDEDTWNFHVWSEAWLARPDLGQGEPEEWNAVDATPQEPSPLAPGQPYRAGPAYVPYIQADMRTANYDTYFILAEVNARGICPITGRLYPTDIGYAVVTKLRGMQRSVYSFYNPEYITNNYKIPSTSKRASETASPELPPPYTGCERDGGMRLAITPAVPRVGDSFTITVTDPQGNVPIVDTAIRMELRNYMGESLGIIRNFTGIRQLNVTALDYFSYLRNTSIFRFSVGVYNTSGNFVFHDALRIRLEYEQLQVVATRVSTSNSITLTLTYTNPLSVPLTGVMVSVSGPFNEYMMMEQSDIPANGRFSLTISLQCGDNDDSDVMIPVSLDSDVTQSVYGTGWSSCSDGSSNGGIAISESSGFQMMLFCLFAVFLYI